MIQDCDEKLLRKFDPNQDYLWLYNSAHGKSGGILCGVKKELYDVGFLSTRGIYASDEFVG
jgi:hypothetical protein